MAAAGLPLCSLRNHLVFDRELPTGIGERLSALLCAAAYAYLFETTLHTYWVDAPVGTWEFLEYSFAEMRDFGLRFPSRLHVLADESTFRARWMPNSHNNTLLLACEGELKAHCAYDLIPHIAFRTMCVTASNHQALLPKISRQIYLAAFRQAAREFHLPLPRADFLDKRYLVLHVRGGDRAHAEQSDFATSDILHSLHDRGVGPVVLVTDDPDERRRWLGTFPWLIHCEAVDAALSNTRSTLYDLALLLHSAGIILHASNAWSAFSMFPALIRDIPVITTWRGPGMLEHFEAVNGKPDIFLRHHEIDRFAAGSQSLMASVDSGDLTKAENWRAQGDANAMGSKTGALSLPSRASSRWRVESWRVTVREHIRSRST